MFRGFFAIVLFVLAAAQANAQQASWLQLEAHPTLGAAQDAARDYAAQLDDVNGFYLGSNWYGVVLGPYSRADAIALRRDLRIRGLIPTDAFISDGARYRQQFWPIGVGAQTTIQPLPDGTDTTVTVETPLAETPVVEVPAPEPQAAPDETVAEARASEATLTRPERELLQIALQWAGFYNSSIDGAFGRGTRGSMSAWQEANGYETTGVLTTFQRAELINQYNAVLEGMDLAIVQDSNTGISMKIPTGVVTFDAYDSPFGRFVQKENSGAQVLLISQPGDRARLFGLYEIMQTLEIVPTDGERRRRDSSFEINGQDETYSTYVTASLDDGEIKGFALIWPAGDEERRSRVLQEMQASFERIDGVLDPATAPAGEDQSIDLVSGLSIRKPQIARSGFYVDGSGTVLTSAETVAQCDRITIEDTFDVTVAWADDTVAVLKPVSQLAPMGMADIQTSVPRLQTQVAVGGFPYGDALTLPTMTFGTLADVRGLDGDETVLRLALEAEDGDVGGPVFDNGGAVIGMLLPKPSNGSQVLPADVSIAYDSDAILASLSEAGVTAQTTDAPTYMAPETLTGLAADMTVLVSCW